MGAMDPLPFRYMVRGLLRRRTSTMLTFASFTLVCFIWMVLQSMIATMRDTLEHSGSTRAVVVMSPQAAAENQSRLDWDGIRWIRSHPSIERSDAGVPRVSVDRSATATIRLHRPDDPPSGLQVNVRGVRLEDAGRVHAGWTLSSGHFPEPGEPGILVGQAFATSRDIRPGDRLELWRTTWVVTGIFRIPGSPLESEMWITSERLAAHSGKTEPSSVWAVLRNESDVETVRMELRDRRGESMELVPETEYFGKGARSAAQLELLVHAVSVILACGAVLSSLNTLYASLSAREGEFAALRAIGFQSSAIRRAMRSEALTIAWAGGVAACLLCLPLAGLQFRTMVSGIGFVVFTLDVDPPVLASGMVFATCMGWLGGWFPSVASTRLPVNEALQKAMAVIMLLTAGPGNAMAQENSEGVRWMDPVGEQNGLIALMDAAWRNHPDVRRLETEIGILELEERIGRLDRLPDLRLQARYDQLGESPRYPRFDPEGGLDFVGQGRPNRFQMQAEVAHDLRGSASSKRRAQADELGLEILRTRLERRKRELEIEIEGHLNAIHHLQSLIQGADRIVEWRIERVRIDEASMMAGSLRADQLEGARIVLLEARRERAGLDSELDSEWNRLSMLTGWRSDSLMNVAGLWAPADAAWCLPPEGPGGTELQTRLRTHPEAREWRHDADRWRALAQAAQVDSRPEWTLSAKAVYSGPKAWVGMDLPGVRELTGELGVRLGFSWREHRSASLRTQRMMRMSDRSDADLRMWELGFIDRWNEIHLEWTAACRELVTAHADLELAVSMERIELNRSDGGSTSRERILDAMLTRMTAWMRTERIRLRIRRLNTAWSGLTLARPYMEEAS